VHLITPIATGKCTGMQLHEIYTANTFEELHGHREQGKPSLTRLEKGACRDTAH